VPYVYRACGDQYGDSDYWTSKGVMLTRIRIKDGNQPWEIDLFSTHLHWGGKLLGEFIKDTEPTWEARVKVRQAQIQELVTFISHHRRQHPSNVAILTGDFNISANDPRTFDFLGNCNEYTNLVRQLETLNLYDQWTDWPYVASPKLAKPDWKGSSGRTDGADWNLYEKYDGPIYMRDPVKDPSEAECPRYDHIFLERPTAQHSFMLDISRIQRRHFKRDGQHHEIAMLSDHLGLDAMLFFSPNT
jgi:endonuclease/exonuclease/phosphatase family metal-dependent hydrolase